MNFTERFNAYLTALDITVSMLSEASGLSISTISRYKTGKRIPAAGSAHLDALTAAIEKIAAGKNASPGGIREALAACAASAQADSPDFPAKLDDLISVLDIQNVYLAQKLRYDPSYISKLRLGRRKPSDRSDFCMRLCRFLLRQNRSKEQELALAGLLECSPAELTSEDKLLLRLSEYLFHTVPQHTHTETIDFLRHLDSFDLNDYIRSIHFDSLQIPSAPAVPPMSKTYCGIEGMKEAELDFEKITVLSDSMQPVFMCSDMAMEDLVDAEFPKQWMSGLALILKKGLKINVIHYLGRPFREMMLGLEAWIPLYMTGQVSPYYLDGYKTGIYQHMLYTSGTAALSGEALSGGIPNGKKYVTNQPQELPYYQKRAEDLLDRAKPLMEIFRQEDRAKFTQLRDRMEKQPGGRINRYAGLPAATMPEPLLLSILSAQPALSDKDKNEIKKYCLRERARYERLLAENTIHDTIPVLTKEQFAETPLALQLGGLFIDRPIFCSYEDYRAHLQATLEFSETHPGYQTTETSMLDFINISISILENRCVLLTKSNAPVIHFVIHHPQLVQAVTDMIIPIQEKADLK